MSSEGSVTHWLIMLRDGDRAGAQKLWEVYFGRLVGLARTKLRTAPRRVADEEDVALSAFDSFCRRAERGQFPQLADRDELWHLLVVLTVRKAASLVRHEGRKSRGEGRVRTLADLAGWEFDSVLGHEPTPELAAQVADEFQRLLGCLDNDTLRSVALWKMEGDTYAEIAAKLGCITQTVERKLRAIRRLWSTEIAP
jgi:DNA-directed RNA polymerase specialized sigma24 family protein